jgi:predicted PurR-regulated permease PerM
MDDPAGSPPGIPIEGEPATGRSPAAPPGSSSNRRLRPPTPRVALVLVGAAVVLITLYLGREALTPFIVGLLIVYLLAPPVERLHRAGLPRPVSILVVYLVATFVLIEAVNLTLRPVVEQMTSLFRDLPRLAAQLDGQLQQLSEVYRGLNLPPQIRASIDEWLAAIAGGDIGFDPGVLMPVVNLTAGFVSSLFGYLIIPVWAFYLLKDRRSLVDGFDHALPAEWRTDVWSVIRITERVLAQWIRGQLFLGVTVGLATFGGLIVLSLVVDPVFGRFALLLALVAGLLELLPIIGPIIAAVPAVLLAATAGPQAVVAALALYVLVQQVENNLLVPKIQGDAVALHPSAVMFALVIGGAVAGLIGAILALPITAAARDVFAYLFGRLDTDAGDLGGGGLAAATTVNQASSLPLSPFLVHVDALDDPQPGSEADQRSTAVADKGQGDPRDRHDPDHHAEVHDQVKKDHRGET